MNIGETLPPFTLTDVLGKTVTDKSLAAANVTVIIFGCNHCPYVKAYLKRINDMQIKYKKSGVELLMINSNSERSHPEDSYKNMQKLMEDGGFCFRYLHDQKAETARAFEAKYTPELFLFDNNKTLRYKGRIDDCWHSERAVKRRDLQIAIDEILAGREVTVKSTTPIGCTIKWS